MSLRLGDIAPDFKARTSIGDISFHEYLGNNVDTFYIYNYSLYKSNKPSGSSTVTVFLA